MLPSINVRLQTLVKALTEVIIPALPEDKGLARDQAMLVIGHLEMIKLQWKYAAKFEAGSLDQLRGLATTIIDECAADISDRDRHTLEALLAKTNLVARDDLDATNGAVIELGNFVDVLISGNGTAEPMPDRLMKIVLQYAKIQAKRERVWFAANHLDPEWKNLPSIKEMVS